MASSKRTSLRGVRPHPFGGKCHSGLLANTTWPLHEFAIPRVRQRRIPCNAMHVTLTLRSPCHRLCTRYLGPFHLKPSLRANLGTLHLHCKQLSSLDASGCLTQDRAIKMIATIAASFVLLPFACALNPSYAQAKSYDIPNSLYDGPVQAEYTSTFGSIDGPKISPRPNSTSYEW